MFNVIISMLWHHSNYSNYHNSNIKNCYNAGEITSNDHQFAGGIVGYVAGTDSIIENCYNSGTISSSSSEGAGIAGATQGNTLNNYNLGTINSAGAGGGIISQLFISTSNPRINGNYNMGTASAGILRYTYSTGTYTISDNYFLNTSAEYGVKSTSSNDGASPLTIDKMPSVISVINGDNAYVEDIKGVNNGYPILKWQQ